MWPFMLAVLDHPDLEQHCDFGSALPPKGSHITPGVNLPPVWERLLWLSPFRRYGRSMVFRPLHSSRRGR